ncbi:hypothetical protein N5A93_13775 [Roseovarius sp. EGI FJ00037]|uniref:hypothetical protein n=1 Tax=Roseovarius salincola TaxID=2978479 RepID=UPI0022A83161|nr:hypothetical protein [Roseovarius sp. EGI FJ00037]MCZ0813309.1 hypothetical protein [Roseovarius sp. EGI FJ00037]
MSSNTMDNAIQAALFADLDARKLLRLDQIKHADPHLYDLFIAAGEDADEVLADSEVDFFNGDIMDSAVEHFSRKQGQGEASDRDASWLYALACAERIVRQQSRELEDHIIDPTKAFPTRRRTHRRRYYALPLDDRYLHLAQAARRRWWEVWIGSPEAALLVLMDQRERDAI